MCLLIPALKRLRQEDDEFRVSLGYIIRPYLEGGKKEKKNRVTLLSSRNSHVNWEHEYSKCFYAFIDILYKAGV